MKTIVIDDDERFYEQLRNAFREGEDVVVETDFCAAANVPDKFHRVFRLEQLRQSALTTAAGTFVAGARFSALSGPDIRSLYVFGGAAGGGLAGLALAGPAGAAVGAVIGGAVGVAAGLVAEDSYEMIFEVDPRGRLRIILKKRRPSRGGET